VTSLVQFGFLLQLGLVAALLIKRLWRKFPYFSFYAVVSLLHTTSYYVLRQHRGAYFYTYWILESITVLLGLAVVYEIFQHLLAAQPALHKLAKRVFQVAAIALLAAGTTVVYLQWPSGAKSLSSGVFVVEEASRVIEIGLLVFLFLFSSIFGLHWRRYEFGIALGLGIFVAVQLAVVTMNARVGLTVVQTLSFIRIISYSSSLLIWLGYILVPESVAVQAEVPKRAQLEQWNRAMMELINQ